MSCPRTVIQISCNEFEILEVAQQGPEGAQGDPGPPGVGVREVYAESPDPVVTTPSINFVGGQFPAYPDVLSMKVFIP